MPLPKYLKIVIRVPINAFVKRLLKNATKPKFETRMSNIQKPNVPTGYDFPPTLQFIHDRSKRLI